MRLTPTDSSWRPLDATSDASESPLIELAAYRVVFTEKGDDWLGASTVAWVASTEDHIDQAAPQARSMEVGVVLDAQPTTSRASVKSRE